MAGGGKVDSFFIHDYKKIVRSTSGIFASLLPVMTVFM
jgi:hypothetical protein